MGRRASSCSPLHADATYNIVLSDIRPTA